MEHSFVKELNRDTLPLLAVELDLPDILNFCRTSKKVNQFVCNNPSFWRQKINRDFPNRIYDNDDFVRDMYKNNPKRLYSLFNSPSKIVQFTKEKYPKLFKNIDHEYFGEFESGSDDLIVDITDLIYPYIKEREILRGDILHFEWLGSYRNVGKAIWSGDHIIPLDHDLDDYGNLPKEFQFPEFPLDHFYRSIAHNQIIWLSKESVNEAIRNFNEETQLSTISDTKGKKYPVRVYTTRRYSKDDFKDYIEKYPYIIDQDADGVYNIGYSF